MNFPTRKAVRTSLRVALQLPLLLMLFLGLVTVPYAHTCLPGTAGDDTTVATHDNNTAKPCRADGNEHPAGNDEKQCCQLEVSNCLHGTGSATLIQSYSKTEPRYPDAITIDSVSYSALAGHPVVLQAYDSSHPSALHDQHTYLVTRRLRI